MSLFPYFCIKDWSLYTHAPFKFLISTFIGGGIDYDSGPYNVTFPPENTIATFDIPVIYDKIEEDNENFTLSISPQLPPLISHDDVIQAIVILHNRDCKSAQ